MCSETCYVLNFVWSLKCAIFLCCFVLPLTGSWYIRTFLYKGKKPRVSEVVIVTSCFLSPHTLTFDPCWLYAPTERTLNMLLATERSPLSTALSYVLWLHLMESFCCDLWVPQCSVSMIVYICVKTVCVSPGLVILKGHDSSEHSGRWT